MPRFELNDKDVVVIVGSGAGGGTMANELTRRGLKVVMFEAGKRQSPASFSQNPSEAFAGTDVITLATRATSPVLTAAAAPPGVHVNAVGAIVPERAEFEPQLLARCAVVSADSVPQTQTLSREFREYYERLARGYARGVRVAQLAGEVDPRYDPEVIAYIYTGLGHFVGMRWAEWTAGSRVPDDVFDDLMDVLARGLPPVRPAGPSPA